MPRLGDALESRIKEHLEPRLGVPAQNSEKFLEELLDENRIVEVGEAVWKSISKTPLSELFQPVGEGDLEDFVIIVYEFWQHFRQSRYFEGIYSELVNYFFEKYGERELDILLEDMGVNQEMIINEILEMTGTGLKKILATGYLEERLRAHLESFYISEKAASLLSDAASRRKRP
jgi:hypothetical protein